MGGFHRHAGSSGVGLPSCSCSRCDVTILGYPGLSDLGGRDLLKCGQEEGWDAKQAATATLNDAPTPLNRPPPPTALMFISCRRIPTNTCGTTKFGSSRGGGHICEGRRLSCLMSWVSSGGSGKCSNATEYGKLQIVTLSVYLWTIQCYVSELSA